MIAGSATWPVALLACISTLAASSGCERKRVARDADAASSPPGAVRDAGSAAAGSSSGSTIACADDPLPLPRAIRFDPVDAVDLLFVVDDSPSMARVQEQLRNTFPKALDTLSSVLFDARAKSLHLGVVSGDLGLGGVEGVEGCTELGDDGRLEHEPTTALECPRNQPAFLEFAPALGVAAAAPARELTCATSLDATGCGLQQPLEAALKALWPAEDERVLFAGEQLGRGSTSNAGFLRDGARGRSVLAIVVVTNKDDCSLLDPAAFAASAGLDGTSGERLNARITARCAEDPSRLHDLARYVDALELLRPAPDSLWVFAAIAGVPPFTSFNFANVGPDNAEARNEFYERLLADPTMQVRVDDHGTPEPDDDTPGTVCDGNQGPAWPARRLVELAQQAGPRGVVGSICENDIIGTVFGVANRIQLLLGDSCLGLPLQRDRAGMVACELIWTLPPDASRDLASACNTPRLPFLEPVAREPLRSAEGGARCRVPQRAASAGDGGLGVPRAEGWYYDDFSGETARTCHELPRRVALTAGVAPPPPEVRVTLECSSSAFGAESPNMGCSLGKP